MIKEFKNYFHSPERNQTADLLKGLAVIFMIQVHIMENFSLHRVYEEITGIISFFLGGTPAAPVFMIVMGYYLAYSQKKLHQQIKRGVLLFAGGILLNIGLNFNLLLSIFSGRFENINPLHYIFGADILPLAGLSIIIISLLRKILEKDWYYYLFVAAAIAFSSPYIKFLYESSPDWLYYVTSFIWGSSEWSYFPLFPWLCYPLLGFSFKLMIDDERIMSINTRKNRMAAFIIGIIFLTLTFSSVYEEIIILENYYHHGFFLAVWNTVFVFCWFLFLDYVELKQGRNIILLYIKWIGKNVTVVYVLQWLIIGNLATELYGTQNEIESLIWFTGVTIVVSVFTFAYGKIIER